tara:strand:- start:484 stop:990 length:507 start_codon:yes stop_codon:yes gene_type:complete
MIFDRVRGLQTKDTLTDPMAGFFVRKYLKGMNPIIDPFARNCEFAWPYTNDIDTSTNAEQHLDAEEFLKRMKDMRFGGAILDPPFSNHQSREIYGSENLYTDPAKMKRIEMELGSLIELGGYVVKFGYNSNFSHKSFECIAVRLVRYGGSMNDMIISVHQRTISGDWF